MNLEAQFLFTCREGTWLHLRTFFNRFIASAKDPNMSFGIPNSITINTMTSILFTSGMHATRGNKRRANQ